MAGGAFAHQPQPLNFSKRKIAVYRPKGKTGWHPSDVIPLFAKSLGNLAPWQTFFGKMPMR